MNMDELKAKFWEYNPVAVENEDIIKMDIYYNSSNNNGSNKPTVGGIVVDCTSEFAFDNLAGCHSQNNDMVSFVKVKHIAEDYSNYDADKCNNGGDYGYDFYEIMEVLSIEEY